MSLFFGEAAAHEIVDRGVVELTGAGGVVSYDIVLRAKEERQGNIFRVRRKTHGHIAFVSDGARAAAFEIDGAAKGFLRSPGKCASDVDIALRFFAEMIDVIQEIQCLLAVGRIERRFVHARLPAAKETATVENGRASAERRRREIRFGSLGQCHMALADDGGLRETELHGAFRERRVFGQRIGRRRDARPRAIAFPLPEKMKFCVFFQNEREETGVIGRVFCKR